MFKNLRNLLNGLPRFWKRTILVAFDFMVLLIILWVAYSLRLNQRFAPNTAQLILMVLAPMTAIPVFIRLGLYRAVIRYLPERAIWSIFQAMTLATLLWVALTYLTSLSGLVAVPRSIPVLYWAMGTVVIASSRFAAKRFLIDPLMRAPLRQNVLIYGAGEAGVQLATALQAHGGKNVVGFIEDDKSLQGSDISGTRVYRPEQITGLIDANSISEIILSMPSIALERRQAIYSELAGTQVSVRALPSITDLAAGKYIINQIREIDIDDLLGRSAVPPSAELIERMIVGRTVLVSGAGGSIGAELCKLIVRANPAKLILLEANEHALYQIDRHLSQAGAKNNVPVLGSVCNRDGLDRIFNTHEIDVIFHAAAHKHVPLVEANIAEGIRNNVFGTRTIADAAYAHGVAQFVLISTDKAVRPSNVMGATKRWAELLMSEFGARAKSEKTGQKFCAVRFGNVLGSNGSVVPLFKEQIAKGGPITLTDERMTRYFMSIHEAAELIVQAGALSEGGDVFLLEMGKPVRVYDLAVNMIQLAGMRVKSSDDPTGDIEINIMGSREGEKLSEELFYEPGRFKRTEQEKILKATGNGSKSKKLAAGLIQLEKHLAAGDDKALKKTLFALVSTDQN